MERELTAHTRSMAHLVDLFDPPVDAVKRPAVGDVIHQDDPLKTNKLTLSSACLQPLQIISPSLHHLFK